MYKFTPTNFGSSGLYTILTRDPAKHPLPFTDVRCDEQGEITIYDASYEGLDRTRKRDNSFMHPLTGLENGMAIYDGEEMLVLRSLGWYSWTYHPRGVIICSSDTVYLITRQEQ